MVLWRSPLTYVVALVAGAVGALGAVVFVDVGGDGTAAPAELATVTSTTTSTTTSSTTTTTTTTTLPPPRSATLLFTGDLLPHAPVVRTAAGHADEGWDFTPMYDRVRPVIEAADFAVCHMETPLSADDSAISGYPFFNAPRAFAEAVAAVGYDACSTASNHAMDRGRDGVKSTIEVLQSFGLGQSGMARFGGEDDTPVIYDVAGIAVAHLSATYGLNGFELPGDQRFLVDLIEPDEILAEAEAARAAGAEFVVVSLHWGVEYRHEPTEFQEQVAAEVLASPDVDLIIGHHAHVVQPVDMIGDEWVVYGLGNFLSNQSANCCATASQDGLIVEVDLHEPATGVVEVAGVRYTPTWVDRRDYTIMPVAAALSDAEVSELWPELERSWARTVEVVESRLDSPDLRPAAEPPGSVG